MSLSENLYPEAGRTFLFPFPDRQPLVNKSIVFNQVQNFRYRVCTWFIRFAWVQKSVFWKLVCAYVCGVIVWGNIQPFISLKIIKMEILSLYLSGTVYKIWHICIFISFGDTKLWIFPTQSHTYTHKYLCTD